MSMRIFIGIVFGLYVVSARSGPLQAGAINHEGPAVSETDGAADEAAARKLAQAIAEVKFDDTGLIDALELLRGKSGAKIVVNWNSLEAAGVDRNWPISLHLERKRLSTILDVMLLVISAEQGKLAYVVDHGVITIASADDLAKNVTVRVYDVRGFMARVGGATRHDRADAIIKFLMARADPKSWKAAGGVSGAIRELEGQLIITQTPENQLQITKLLRDLTALLLGEK